MASQSRREISTLIDQLFQEGYRFDFFQAVRLLEQVADAAQTPGVRPVGYDHHPSREVARFRALPAHSFPATTVASVERPADEDHVSGKSAAAQNRPAALTVGFMGLTGPQGVLPQHYTSMVIERIRAHDHGIQDFFDLFNHRLIALFYRAWEKYRFTVGYERFQRSAPAGDPDLFTDCLYSLVGLGTPHLREQLDVDNESILFYAGQFSQGRRSAVGLERLLTDYFGLPVEIEQFAAHRERLNPEDRWNLPDRQRPLGRNSELGAGMVLGTQVWIVQSRFRIRLGPLNYEQFRRFWPTGDDLRLLCELARLYAGPELDFEIQPLLEARETPEFRLNAPEPNAPRLGWNTWVRSSDSERDNDQVIFLIKTIEI
jgi:type VI secretion system protein ImpH